MKGEESLVNLSGDKPEIKHAQTTIRTEYLFELKGLESGQKGVMVKIGFTNGAFDACHFPFSGIYTRAQWKLLSLVEAEIGRIENNELERKHRGVL